MNPVLETLLRPLSRPYIGMYDAAMRLGPTWGPVALGYGPVVLGVVAFVLKSRLLDPVMDPGTATVAIFVAFALCGPLLNIGTRIVSENLHKGRTGQWPATNLPRFDNRGPVSPTMMWVEAVRGWAKGD